MISQPGWKAWLAVVFTVMASIGVNVLISINLANRAAEAQSEVACNIARTQDGIYTASPPSTETGRLAAAAWDDARWRWCGER